MTSVLSPSLRLHPRLHTASKFLLLSSRQRPLVLAPTFLSRQNLSTNATNTDTGTPPAYSDVLIVGGGVVGCALARLLNRRLPHLSVHLLEARDAPPATTTETTSIPHPRSYALSPQSLELLGLLSKSGEGQKVKMGSYDSMQIWEARNPATMSFHTDDLPFVESKLDRPKILGAVVEDSAIVQALWKELSQNKSKPYLSTQTTLTDLRLPQGSSHANSLGLVTVETSNKTTHQTRLLVAADGAQSPIRKQLGVPQMQWDYGRQALTFTVELAHDDSLPRTAYQRFVHADGGGSGPLALLPTYSPRHAIVVWSTTNDVVEKWKSLDADKNQELVDQLNSMLQQGPQRLPPLVDRSSTTSNSPPPILSQLLFGVERVLDVVQDAGAMAAATASPTRGWMAPPLVANVVSPKLSFPLACRNVHSYQPAAPGAERVVILGDAAHTVHPMAGQGLNLGLAAVQSLVESLEETESVGMDIMANDTMKRFLQKRHAHNSAAILGIHALHEIFAMEQNVPLMHAKSFGMNVLQQVGPLRRKIVQAATQGVLF